MSKDRQGPCVYISGLPRSTPRSFWKVFYRLARVAARESEKASIDTMLYGVGYIECPSDGGDPRHIPIDRWAAPVEAKP